MKSLPRFRLRALRQDTRSPALPSGVPIARLARRCFAGVRGAAAGVALIATALAADSKPIAVAATGATPAALAPIEGALPNGLRYTLFPHGRGLGRISLRLVVLAGSLDERDDERGYAHFVEHMAFEGTRHHPPGTLAQFFQSLGLAYGEDLNAHTYFTSTIYKLDLPAGRGNRVGDALEVLRDFADGIQFPDTEVAREKGVVLAELGARNKEDAQMARQRIAALYAGTPLPDRHPSGDSGVIARATAGTLRAFYQRTYQPARMRVAIVGDIEPAAAQKLIHDHFASLRAHASAVAPVAPAPPPRTGFSAHVINSAPNAGANAALYALVPCGPDTPAARERLLARGIVTYALGRRLAERRAREPSRFGHGGSQVHPGADGRFAHFIFEASAAPDDWQAAVALVETELRRTREHGFTPAELKEQITTWLAVTRAHRDSFPGDTPDVVADSVASALAIDRAWRTPAAQLAEGEAFLAQFTPAVATATLRELLPDPALQLHLTTPATPAGGTGTVLAAYRASAARPLGPQVEFPPEALQFRYGDFGPRGGIAERRSETDLKVELVRFANGARLNLRGSQSEPAQFHLTARLGHGLVDLPRDRPGLAHFAAHFIDECHLGRHSNEEIARLLSLRAVSSHITYSDRQFVLAMNGPARELPFALQYLTALVSDVRLERPRVTSGLSSYGACRASHRDDAAGIALTETMVQMAGDDSRLSQPNTEEVSHYPFPGMVEWIRRHWLEGPLEVGIAGDFSPALVIDAAAASIGTLPRRREPAPIAPADKLALRAKPGLDLRREPLTDQSAAVQLSWGAPALRDPRRPRALTFASAVLEDRLQKKLRQELGATYSPDGRLVNELRQRDYGFATMALTFEPSRAEEYARRTIEIASELAREGVTAEEFQRLREPLMARAAEALRSNTWWVEVVLAHAQGEPGVLDDARLLPTIYSDLTREEINRVAAACFPAANAHAVIVLPVAPDPVAVQSDPTTAEGIAQRGDTKFERGDLAGALLDLDRALVLDPNYSGALVTRGATRAQLGDVAGALADLNRAIALDPKSAVAHGNRAALWMRQGNLPAALADCDRALELDPAMVLAWSNRGGVKVGLGDFAGAIVDCERALELDSKHANAYANRGVARLGLGNLAGAIADSTTALGIDPHNVDAWHNRGFAKQSLGDHPGALPDFDRALELNPEGANSYRQRGVARHATGDTAGAMADYDRATTLNPADVLSLNNRGILRQARGELPAAIADYDAALRVDPEHAEAFNNRGWAKQAAGDLDGAIADYTRAIELRPNFALAYTNRGNARKAKGDRFGAMDDLDLGIKFAAPVASNQTMPPPPPLPPPPPRAAEPSRPAATASADSPEALVRTGNAKRTQRDFPGAIADYSKALEKNPALVSALVARGLARSATRDFSGAIADYSAALGLQENLPLAWFNRGLAYEAQRKFDRAIADFSKAIELSPRHAPAFNGRGYARLWLGDVEAALADFTRAIEIAPTLTIAYHNRAQVRQTQGDFAAAVVDYDLYLKTTTTAHYAALYRIVCLRLTKRDPGPDFKTTVSRWSEGWIKSLGQFLTGELAAEALLDLARRGGGRTPLSRLCEAHYFLGAIQLADGHTAAAREHFEKCVATGERTYSAFRFARDELARMEKNR